MMRELLNACGVILAVMMTVAVASFSGWLAFVFILAIMKRLRRF
jgi:hypothetical protein